MTPTWQQLVTQPAPLEERLGRLTPERRGEVEAVLARVAAQPATLEGIAAAWKAVADALPGLEKPNFSGSGEGHNRSALRGAAKQVLGTLVGRAAAGMKQQHELDALLAALAALPAMHGADLETLSDEARERFGG